MGEVTTRLFVVLFGAMLALGVVATGVAADEHSDRVPYPPAERENACERTGEDDPGEEGRPPFCEDGADGDRHDRSGQRGNELEHRPVVSVTDGTITNGEALLLTAALVLFLVPVGRLLPWAVRRVRRGDPGEG